MTTLERIRRTDGHPDRPCQTVLKLVCAVINRFIAQQGFLWLSGLPCSTQPSGVTSTWTGRYGRSEQSGPFGPPPEAKNYAQRRPVRTRQACVLHSVVVQRNYFVWVRFARHDTRTDLQRDDISLEKIAGKNAAWERICVFEHGRLSNNTGRSAGGTRLRRPSHRPMRFGTAALHRSL